MENITEGLRPLAINIDSVKEDPKNARKHPQRNLEVISASLRAYGQRKPIVVNRNTGIIEAGNALWISAKALGWTQVAVLMVEDAPDSATGYAIMDNRSAEISEWDIPILQELLTELEKADYDMDLTGFDERALNELLDSIRVPAEGLIDDDDVPEAPEPVCQPGDLWQLGEHHLYCSSSTDRAQVEVLMGNDRADLVITDPPYGINYDTSATGRSQKNWEPIANDQPDPVFFRAWVSLLPDFAKIQAAYYIFISDRTRHILTGILDELKIHWTVPIIWVKQSASITWDRYHPRHEVIIFSGEGSKPTGKNSTWYGPKNETTVWEIDREPNGEYVHPTQKPVALGERMLRNSSRRHGVVLDLFGGSGSTLIACEKMERRCRMMELKPAYCDVIINRWQKYTGREAVKLNKETD